MSLLETEGLTKDFGGLRAVHDLALRVEEGEIVGLIGPNGSGKTTCFNLITGLYQATDGRIRFDHGRLEIARGLAAEPRLLLLDEPAAGMNPTETRELMRDIRRIREAGVTILLIEHDMGVVRGICDRVAALDHGTKIAEGSFEEVRRSPAVLEAYLGRQAGRA